MLGNQFYHGLIRKYVIIMGTLINDIYITRDNGDIEQLLKIPVTYAPKEKVLVRFDNDPDIDRGYAVLLPRISFELQSMEYDNTRKLVTVNKQKAVGSSNNTMKSIYSGVPYNFNFKVWVYVKNTEDGTKIVEQILPFFTPDFTITANMVPEMGIIDDVPVILKGIEIQDMYTGKFEERKIFLYTLDFTIRGFFYGPVKDSSIIKYANTTLYIPPADMTVDDAVGAINGSERVIVQPGLTANGAPTSNSSLSIPVNQIKVTDDFGFVTTTQTLIVE